MAVGDIYQVKLFQTLNAESCLNVFFYRQVIADVGNQAEELALDFLDDIVTPLRSLISNTLTYNQIQVVNGMDNTEQHVEDLVATTGDRAVTSAPTNIAIAFRKRTGGIGFRYSYKRFAGVPITAITPAGYSNIGGDFFTDLGALAAALGGSVAGSVAEFEPIQITGGFQLLTTPTFKQLLTGEWQVNDRVSHQDTRQQYEWTFF